MTQKLESLKKLVDRLLEVSEKNGHYIVAEPYNIYLRDLQYSFIYKNYSVEQIQEMIQMNSTPFSFAENTEANEAVRFDAEATNPLLEEVTEKYKVIYKIMAVVDAKNINFLGQNYNIFFKVDTDEDLIENFSVNQLHNILELVEKHDDVVFSKESTQQKGNEMNVWWRKNSPSRALKILPTDSMETVYGKAKAVLEKTPSSSPAYSKIFDYMNDLYEMIEASEEQENRDETLT
ncbi:hypothetical protein [Planomicrobium sp. CPCC 101079]|uniref:hypothetical protein n=1 Tax=Planomicrobium sp. CPCC 101079 TaxID=2599618 RepID=UPI0011B4479D|nr:hypothetical protein [Planomicrobium sp. CPCC 101079]TWT01434.1 hypothetical protein FQV28_15265 [Planomicrobium sp. CPCC 101079]